MHDLTLENNLGNGIWNVRTSLPVSTYEKINLSK